eukprot:1186148-Prorocentrum_minimum.AAC.6
MIADRSSRFSLTTFPKADTHSARQAGAIRFATARLAVLNFCAFISAFERASRQCKCSASYRDFGLAQLKRRSTNNLARGQAADHFTTTLIFKKVHSVLIVEGIIPCIVASLSFAPSFGWQRAYSRTWKRAPPK